MSFEAVIKTENNPIDSSSLSLPSTKENSFIFGIKSFKRAKSRP